MEHDTGQQAVTAHKSSIYGCHHTATEGNSVRVQAVTDLLQTSLQGLCLHKPTVSLHHHQGRWSDTYFWSVDADVRMKGFHIGVLQSLHQGLVLHIRSVCQKAG